MASPKKRRLRKAAWAKIAEQKAQEQKAQEAEQKAKKVKVKPALAPVKKTFNKKSRKNKK